jgi:hypothetical protein
MHNVRKLAFVLSSAALILACSLVGTPGPSSNDVATVVAATVQALTPAVSAEPPTSEAAVPQGVPVKYKNVSFVIPSGLATDATPQTVPAADDQNGPPWDAGPEHMEFTLNNYALSPGHFSQVLIDVYPAQGYADANAGANISLQRLRALLSNPSAPLANQTLPQVPAFNAASMFAAQVKRMQFKNGDGVRMITQYGQAVGPAANNGTFYHFEGLTSDGKSYVIAVLPIEAAFLQNGNDPSAPLPPGGIPFPGYNFTDPKHYTDYFKAITDKLDATPPDQFSPSLTALDALVQSISVNP